MIISYLHDLFTLSECRGEGARHEHFGISIYIYIDKAPARPFLDIHAGTGLAPACVVDAYAIG